MPGILSVDQKMFNQEKQAMKTGTMEQVASFFYTSIFDYYNLNIIKEKKIIN